MNPCFYILFFIDKSMTWTMTTCFENYWKIVCYDRFWSFIKFWSREINTDNTMSDLYFNEESNYSEENTSDNEDFHPTILQLFQFEPEQK